MLDQILQQRFNDLKVMFTSVEKVAGLWNGISELHRECWLVDFLNAPVQLLMFQYLLPKEMFPFKVKQTNKKNTIFLIHNVSG